MEPAELIIIVVFVLAFVKIAIVDRLPYFKELLIADFHDLINDVTTWKFLAIALLVVYPITLYIVHHLTSFISNILQKRNERKLLIWNNKLAIPSLLEQSLREFDLEKARQFLNDVKNRIELSKQIKELSHFTDRLVIKLEKAQLKVKELEHEEKLEKIRKERDIVEKHVELLEMKKQELENEKEQEITDIWRRLNGYEINVFLREDLKDFEINALLKRDFISTTEYCVFEKKLIKVILKRTMHHSPTHTFLVWSVGRLLESLPKITHIDEHNTRDADLTFKCKKEAYALEIETGTLLSKKSQLRNKVSYLNRKYSGKWMFVVSNKNLASKYSKFGLVSTRKDVEKKLKKMLKLAT